MKNLFVVTALAVSWTAKPLPQRLALQSMPEAEKDAFLLRLLDDEPRLSLTLHQHLGLHAGTPSASDGARRTVGEVLGAVK